MLKSVSNGLLSVFEKIQPDELSINLRSVLYSLLIRPPSMLIF